MSALASKLWAAVRPTHSVSVALNCNRPLSTTMTIERRHKDLEGKRSIWRYGYEDKLKMSGTLPRIGNDYDKIKAQNPFAPSNALYGQNDYFDILGDDHSHVTQ